ncbi:MAG: hypothetical protein AAGJ56_01260 [Myxococcota bacterium]
MFVVDTDPLEFAPVLDGFEASPIRYVRAELTMIAENSVTVVGDEPESVLMNHFSWLGAACSL